MTRIFNRPTGIAYFDELESPAFSSVQTLWDRIAVNGMGAKFVVSSFNKDMISLGYPRPSEKDMNRLIAAIEAGSSDRPAREGDEVAAKVVPARAKTSSVLPAAVVASVPVVVPADADVPLATVETAAPVAETNLEEVSKLDPVSTLRDRMMSEAMDELQRDIEVQARKLVAARLRVMADAFERGEV